MAFIVNILFRIGEIIILAILQVIVGAVLSRLNRLLGQRPSEVKYGFSTMFNTLRGHDKYKRHPTLGKRVITCESCGALVPRRTFCENCGLRLKKSATSPARK